VEVGASGRLKCTSLAPGAAGDALSSVALPLGLVDRAASGHHVRVVHGWSGGH
jgi:hypothetical protein